ncbi:MAG: hypothetical protein AAGF27_11220 [Pseudomonadota bacterium]
MTDKTAPPENTRLLNFLITSAPHLAGVAEDAMERDNVYANLATVLALAATLEDIGYEAAPVFRA